MIADHARASTFLISDGVVPANEGRGYVLRKIIRRAIRHGRLLGQEKPFLFEMVFAVRDLMKDAYPEIVETADRVSETIKGEETRFAHTLDIGLQTLEDDIILESSIGVPRREILQQSVNLAMSPAREHATQEFPTLRNMLSDLKDRMASRCSFPAQGHLSFTIRSAFPAISLKMRVVIRHHF